MIIMIWFNYSFRSIWYLLKLIFAIGITLLLSKDKVTHPGRIAETILQFYQELFATSSPDRFEEIIEQIPQVVSTDMNQQLTREFTVDDVEIALKQMAPLKSPGPDGMLPLSTKIIGPW